MAYRAIYDRPSAFLSFFHVVSSPVTLWFLSHATVHFKAEFLNQGRAPIPLMEWWGTHSGMGRGIFDCPTDYVSGGWGWGDTSEV